MGSKIQVSSKNLKQQHSLQHHHYYQHIISLSVYKGSTGYYADLYEGAGRISPGQMN